MFRFAACLGVGGEAGQGLGPSCAPHTRGGGAGNVPPREIWFSDKTRTTNTKQESDAVLRLSARGSPNPAATAAGPVVAATVLKRSHQRDAPNTSAKSPWSNTRRGRRRNNLTRVVLAAALCDKGLVLPVSPVPYAAGNQGPWRRRGSWIIDRSLVQP